MKLYKSCKTLPIHFFFRIFDTKDYRNLVVGFDEENDTFVLSEDEKLELEDIFDEILYEYSELTDNHNVRANYKKQILLKQYETEYLIVTECLKLYADYEEPLFLNMLSEVGYPIDLENDIDKQIQGVVAKMKGLKNKINISKANLEKSSKNDRSDIKVDLDRDALYLERNLDLKRAINPKETTVSQWLNLIQMDKEKQKEYDKIQSRNRKR